MDLEERIISLRRTALFTAFPDAELAHLAADISEVSLERGEILFSEGESGEEMFILIEGCLRIFKENRIITAILPGDYVGEMAIIDDKPRSATVEAVEPSRLLRITSEQFRDYLGQQPHALVSMITTLSQRIRRDIETIAADYERANILIHDMKNALAIFLYLDLLRKEFPADSKAAALIERMRMARTNLATMMEEALASARGQWRAQPLAPSSLADLITEVAETECPVHPDVCDKKLRTAIDPDVPEFPFSRLEIRRVLTNLIVNAGQASLPGAAIDVALRRSGGWAEVTVRDEGVGIPAELFDKIFIPHFTTKATGSGLGLASCKQIVEEHHGGTISVQANPDCGATFCFRLPLEPLTGYAASGADHG